VDEDGNNEVGHMTKHSTESTPEIPVSEESPHGFDADAAPPASEPHITEMGSDAREWTAKAPQPERLSHGRRPLFRT
jgi:hypothetical protein